jgi:hypothetical protein
VLLWLGNKLEKGVTAPRERSAGGASEYPEVPLWLRSSLGAPFSVMPVEAYSITVSELDVGCKVKILLQWRG